MCCHSFRSNQHFENYLLSISSIYYYENIIIISGERRQQQGRRKNLITDSISGRDRICCFLDRYNYSMTTFYQR